MSAAKANRQRVRAQEIRTEIARLMDLPAPALGNRITQDRIRRLETELRGLRFKD